MVATNVCQNDGEESTPRCVYTGGRRKGKNDPTIIIDASIEFLRSNTRLHNCIDVYYVRVYYLQLIRYVQFTDRDSSIL